MCIEMAHGARKCSAAIRWTGIIPCELCSLTFVNLVTGAVIGTQYLITDAHLRQPVVGIACISTKFMADAADATSALAVRCPIAL